MAVAALSRLTHALRTCNASRQGPCHFALRSISSSSAARVGSLAEELAPEPRLPVIDLSPIVRAHHAGGSEVDSDTLRVAAHVHDAFAEWGAFHAVGHGVVDAPHRLADASRQFFQLPLEEKMALHVQNGGPAWRGYMPRGGEQTKGLTDQKEGLYMSFEHPPSHPLVQAGAPLFGANQFPDEQVPALRPAALQYIDDVTEVGHRVMELVSLGLGLSDAQYIRQNFTSDPIALVRAFNYPSLLGPDGAPPPEDDSWGIGAHTDYGLLTILHQEDGGLEFEHPVHGWVDASPPGDEPSFVCSVGLTFPFFFDPSWDAEMRPLPLDHLPPMEDPGQEARWAATSIVRLEGPYSQFLAKKVRKVFQLPDEVDGYGQTKAASTRFHIQIKA